MSFAANIEEPKIEKYPLVVLRPRRKVTAWTSMGGVIYRAPFSFGYIESVWIQFGVNLTRAASASVIAGEFYYDHYNGYLYVGSVVDPTAVGRFVEYELNLSTQYFRGPRDPLDATSQVVDWQPYLQFGPSPQNGSRDTLYGFNPLVQSSLTILNAGGWLNPHLHESSFRLSVVKTWLMANSNYDQARARSDIKQTFLGYLSDVLTISSKVASFSCVDFFGFLDRQTSHLKFTTALAPNCEPNACTSGAEWLVRKIRGRVERLRPVNVDYQKTPDVAKNRDWVVMEEIPGGDEATYTLSVDHLAANTATKTFFTTTPPFMAGDAFAMTNDGVTRYSTVVLVDYVNKWVTHGDFSGRTITALDNCTRYWIGSVSIVRDDGTVYQLMPSRDFQRGYGILATLPADTMGIILVDDFEAAVGMASPFNPASDKIYCTIYGQKTTDTYSDAVTPVGAASDYGGADSSPEALLYWLLTLSGMDPELIDENSLQNAGSDNDAPLGLAIPQNFSDTDAPTYKEMIQLVLQSALWRLGFVAYGNEVKIGIAPTQPFVAGGDYDVDELDHRSMEYEHDYGSTYLQVRIPFNKKEYLGVTEAQEYKLGSNDLARDLHLATRTLVLESLHYRTDDAEVLKDRLVFAVSDRRAFYKFVLEQRFIDKTNIGATYDLTRQDLPGFEFVPGTNRTRQLAAIEVVKSSLGVTLVLEDQKGIQDNSGSW